MVSGIAISSQSGWGNRHHAALAVIGARGVEAAIRADPPGEYQMQVHPVLVDAHEVGQLAGSANELPAGPSDDSILSFEVE